MQYDVNNGSLQVVIEGAEINAVVGEAAKIDVGEAINYIRSGQAEIGQAVQEGLTEFNSNATSKTTAYNDNASAKLSAYNQNATEKTNEFNLNAQNKTSDFNSNATNKTNTFNQNALDKTSEFNLNAQNKTSDFNDNAVDKTNDFNSNAQDKTGDFNDNAVDKTNDFNDNATDKTGDFNDNAQNKTSDFNDNFVAKKAIIDSQVDLAKDWATKTDGTVDGVDYSAKYYAQSILPIASDITTVASISSDVTNVSSISSDVTNVASNATDISTVAGISSDVSTVAGDSASITAVAADLTNINAVAADLTNIDAASGYAAEAKQWAIGDPSEPSAGSAKYWAGQAAAGQVQADWTEADTTSKAYIKNKPIVDASPTLSSTNLVQSGGVYTGLNNLQTQIDAIVASSDVFDIVANYAALQAYDITTVPVNDIIKVLVDETHSGAATYYRCVESGDVKSWSYIGAEGAYYTKGEADVLLAGRANTDLSNLSVTGQAVLDAKANDSAVVKLTGDQTIAGVKTFTTDVKITANTPIIRPRSTTMDITQTGWASGRNSIWCEDKNGNESGGFYNTISSGDTAVRTSIYAISKKTGTQKNYSITVGVDGSGNAFTSAPTPATSDNSSKIATTAYVKNQGYVTSSGTVAKANSVTNQRDGSTGIKTWTGTKTQYNAIATKDANTLYNITDDTDVSLTILEALYPVGSIYITTANTCPLATLISGSTWALVSSGRVLQGADSGHTAGTTIEAGLPNITGSVTNGSVSGQSYAWRMTGDGVFYEDNLTSYQSKATTQGSQTNVGVKFDASRSSSIYGNSTTVQPPAYVVNIWKRTA